MSEPVVVGSGHAGVATAKRLVALGFRPTIVDVGVELPDERAVAVRHLSQMPPERWSRPEAALVTENPTVRDRIPRRLDFGSNHAYADDDPRTPVSRSTPNAPVPSLARGGFSTVWGAAMLPAADCDMAGWPFGRDELEPYYRAVLSDMPMSGAADGLDREFPLFKADAGQLRLPNQATILLDRLRSDRQLADRDDVVFGRARLAVRAGADDPSGCVYCGRCLSGCVYGSIWDALHDLQALERSGQIRYLGGRVVRTIDETTRGVRVHCDVARGGREVIEASTVFLAAGAMNSTRIVLESQGAWRQPVQLRSTQGFVLPMLQLDRTAEEQLRNTLAALFVEFKVPGSDHWVHAQLNSPNELVHQRIDYRPGGRRVRDRALRPLVRHAVVALCNIHSSHAGTHELRLVRRPSGPPVLRVLTRPNDTFPPFARRVARELTRILARSGVRGVASSLQPRAGGPSSWHVGATMPMRADPTGAFETDLLGRPSGFENLHVVDSSVFSTIPATTVALLAMANATRIVDAVCGAEPPTVVEGA